MVTFSNLEKTVNMPQQAIDTQKYFPLESRIVGRWGVDSHERNILPTSWTTITTVLSGRKCLISKCQLTRVWRREVGNGTEKTRHSSKLVKIRWLCCKGPGAAEYAALSLTGSFSAQMEKAVRLLEQSIEEKGVGQEQLQKVRDGFDHMKKRGSWKLQPGADGVLEDQECLITTNFKATEDYKHGFSSSRDTKAKGIHQTPPIKT